MNILIAYATNSGSTFLVSQKVQEVLQQQGHQIMLKDIQTLPKEEVSNYDMVFFGSNSWDFEGKEGQPHHAFMKFLGDSPDVDWSGKRFALFGCGDQTYMIFCGALNVIQEFVIAHGGQLVDEPFKIDRFYFNDQDVIFAELEQWVNKVMNKQN